MKKKRIKRKKFLISLPEVILERVDAVAEEEQKNRTTWIEEAIRGKLKKRSAL